MTQPEKLNNFPRASLRRPRSARTVLLRMAADEQRAQRIKALKERHPELTWRYIGDKVGVTERAAAAWGQTGGIAWPNAKKLAAVFIEAGEDIDADYIWRGEVSTPNLGEVLGDGHGQLDRIEQLLTRLAADQEAHELAQKALGEALTVLASEVAALREPAPARRRRAS